MFSKILQGDGSNVSVNEEQLESEEAELEEAMEFWADKPAEGSDEQVRLTKQKNDAIKAQGKRWAKRCTLNKNNGTFKRPYTKYNCDRSANRDVFTQYFEDEGYFD